MEIRLLTNLGIESQTLMFHLVRLRPAQSGLAAVWGGGKKKKKAHTLKQIHGRVLTRKNVRSRGG